MNILKMDNKVWIGLATIIPLEDNNDLGSAKGASVNILHLAFNEKDFANKVKNQLVEYGYELQELEDVEPFNSSIKYGDNLNDLADIVINTKTLQWGTFYTFDK